MKLEEKIKIDTNSLLEELRYYEYMNETYCIQLKAALSPFDLDKIIFCLNRLGECFEENNDCQGNNSDYIKLQRLLSIVKNFKTDKDKLIRESIPLMQFWTALNAWLDDEAKDPAILYSSKYQDGYSDFEHWVTVGSVNNDSLYKTIYGKPFIEVTEQNISYSILKDFLEAYYREVIEPKNGRLKFTVKVNELLARFKLCYKLQKGKLVQIGYKTSYKLDKIENFEQFERKIEYATEMIMHSDFTDKHCALKYIADSFCYFYSLYDKDDKKLAELINTNNNSNIYKLIKDEIVLIRRIINNDFDIRHNEENSAQQNGLQHKREILTDPIFTEYLYNRISSLLMLMRIKRNQITKSEQLSKTVVEFKETDDLPF